MYFRFDSWKGASEIFLKRKVRCPFAFIVYSHSPGGTFHYCKVSVSETKVTFEMVGLDKDTGR